MDIESSLSRYQIHCVIVDAYGRGELLFVRKFPDNSLQLANFIDAHLINRDLTYNLLSLVSQSSPRHVSPEAKQLLER